MDLDESHFFREATLRICSSLDVETFLSDSFRYIRSFVPADRVYMTHYYPERREQLALATASTGGGTLLNKMIPVPERARKFLGRPGEGVQVIDRAGDSPVAQHWIKAGFLKPDTSILSIRLQVEGKIIGALIFTAEGTARFTKEHARLLTLLREPFTIAMSNSLRYRELFERNEFLVEDNRLLYSELRQAAGEEVIGADFGLRRVMEMVRQVASLTSPVLLLGETGTGKEVIANAIHDLSRRKASPMIKVNCGAIPESLIDSELFGHEKGAFTGALFQKRGRFERAHRGTLFLDEVGELPPKAQVRLLRALQEKTIERVGGSAAIPVDIRLIAATNRDLEVMIREGAFREDLYFRLNVFPILIPPLRERKDDIPALVQHFLQKKARDMGLKGVPFLEEKALTHLLSYSWPGNVRELENAVERTLILSRGGPLTFNDIGETAAGPPHRPLETVPHPAVSAGEHVLPLDKVIAHHISRAMKKTGGQVGGEEGAARLLGLNPSTLRKKMRKLGIPFGRKCGTAGSPAGMPPLSPSPGKAPGQRMGPGWRKDPPE